MRWYGSEQSSSRSTRHHHASRDARIHVVKDLVWRDVLLLLPRLLSLAEASFEFCLAHSLDRVHGSVHVPYETGLRGRLGRHVLRWRRKLGLSGRSWMASGRDGRRSRFVSHPRFEVCRLLRHSLPDGIVQRVERRMVRVPSRERSARFSEDDSKLETYEEGRMGPAGGWLDRSTLSKNWAKSSLSC